MDIQELLANFFNTPTSYESLALEDVVLALLLTFILELYVFYVYKKTFKGVVYTREYNVSLVLTGLVVALVVLPIRSNLTLSLGMVGALSIIRFRTTVKDPKDIVFTFWAIAIGIVCGSGLYMIAIIGVPMIGFFLYVLEVIGFRSPEPYLMVVHYESGADGAVKSTLPRYTLQSQTVTSNGVELIGEIKMNSEAHQALLDKLFAVNGVKDASLVRFTADSM
jgi:hypothetical protein